MGSIGLPDIQRPFVWKNSKVRDLFDSIFRGYPVGYFLFWQNAYDGSQKQIGSNALQDRNYYNFVSDGFQMLCKACCIMPCVLDAAIFSSFDEDNWGEESLVW